MPIRKGLITALITPFNEKGEIDFKSFEGLIEQQLKGGVQDFVLSGTTGESPNLSIEEVHNLFKVLREKTLDSSRIIIGAGSNSTKGTIDRIKSLEELGPDGYLVVVPYYNKPTQEGLIRHFSAIASETEKEILLYDVPGRTITELSIDSIFELSKVKNIVGLKDATGNLEKIKKVRDVVDKNFLLFSGDDETACDFMKLGGDGVVSVLSHVIPKEFKSCMKGELSFSKYKELCQFLFIESNPAPVKAVLKKMKVIKSDQLRLPLVTLSKEYEEILEKNVLVIEGVQ